MNDLDDSLEPYQAGPLLLEGYGLRKKDGHVLLCISTQLKSFHASPSGHWSHAPAGYEYEYEMFDDGEIHRLDSVQVLDVLEDGGRIVITET